VDEEFNDYILQTSKINTPVLMINNFSKTSKGGCYSFIDGKVDRELPLGEEGFLIIQI
jgi:hypothetical protein